MFRHVNKLVGIVLMATLSTGALSQDVYQSAHHDYRVVPVAEDLVQPWSMAWLPNGDMLITEKPGRLRMVRDGQLLPEAIPELLRYCTKAKVVCLKSCHILTLMRTSGFI